MLRCLIVTVAALAGLGSSVAGQDGTFPPAFPRDGATLTFSNEWIAAWDVTWAVNSPTLMHRHGFDYFGVELTTSRTQLTSPDGRTRTASLERGQAWFLAKGTTHTENGLTADPPRRAIIVELKQASRPRVANTTAFPTGPVSENHAPVIDNEQISMWNVTWLPDETQQTRFNAQHAVVLFVQDCELEWTDAGGARRTQSYEAGQVEFLPAGMTWSVRSLREPARVAITMLKGTK